MIFDKHKWRSGVLNAKTSSESAENKYDMSNRRGAKRGGNQGRAWTPTPGHKNGNGDSGEEHDPLSDNEEIVDKSGIAKILNEIGIL